MLKQRDVVFASPLMASRWCAWHSQAHHESTPITGIPWPWWRFFWLSAPMRHGWLPPSPNEVQDSTSNVRGFTERAGHSTPPVFACLYPRGRARAGTVRWGEGAELVMHVKVAGIYFRLVEVAVLQYSRRGFAFT